jgi:hypothetical protein
MQVSNDEDTGFVGYWALDNYQKSIVVWETTDLTTFCALVQYAGTFQTFAGALSPQNGVTELRDGSGGMNGGYAWAFTATLLSTPTKPVSGFIGTFNFGGTKKDILLGSYSAPQTGNLTPVDWTTFYFSSGSVSTFNPSVWAWTYTLGTGLGFGRFTKAGYGDMWVNANGGSLGDIVT